MALIPPPQEEAERKAMVARKKREDELAGKFADEMGMGDVGRNTGIAGAAKRMKMFGGKASPVGCALLENA